MKSVSLLVLLTVPMLSAAQPGTVKSAGGDSPGEVRPARNVKQYTLDAEANKQGLMIFVGEPVRRLFTNGVLVRDDQYNDGVPGIYVLVWDKKKQSLSDDHYKFRPGVTQSEINAWSAGRTVQPTVAAPFAVPDGSVLATGLWPKSLPKPDGLQRYKRAEYTQSLFNRNVTARVPRDRLLLKWQVPGGMEAIEEGAESALYRRVPSEPRTWRDTIYVFNGSNDQPETGYVRSYPNGSLFADVLSKGGVVFEVRYAEKVAGRWERYVAYQDPTARPRGYVRLKSRQCAECHNQTGTGNYDAGLVPGGDTIISDPLIGLE